MERVSHGYIVAALGLLWQYQDLVERFRAYCTGLFSSLPDESGVPSARLAASLQHLNNTLGLKILECRFLCVALGHHVRPYGLIGHMLLSQFKA